MANPKNSPSKTSSDLASYIVDTLYNSWRQNREATQDKWERNREAFLGLTTHHWKTDDAEGWRSQTFIKETKIKVLAVFGTIVDILLTGGKMPFMLSPAPEENITLEDLPEDQRALIDDQIEDMSSIINQQLADGNADLHLKRNVLACVLFGETWGKRIITTVVRRGWRQMVPGPQTGPIEDMSRVAPSAMMYVQQDEIKTAPGWEYRPNWNIFRDMETDDLQACVGIIDRALVSPYWLRQRVGKPMYIDSQLQLAIDEAAKSATGDAFPSDDPSTSYPPYLRDVKSRYNTVRYLEFWGRAPRKYVEEFEAEMEAKNKGWSSPNTAIETEGQLGATSDAEVNTGDEVEIMACVAGEHIVRFSRTTPKDRPFVRAVCEETPDENWGTGVADNVEDMQKVLNGAFRAFEDNKKLSGNVMAAIKERYIEGEVSNLKPGGKFHVTDDCDDARKAISPIVIPDVGESLMSVIELARQFVDEESSVPRISQGIDTDPNPNTAYEISVRVEKAGKYIASIIRNLDQGLIEPMITEFYDYNMADPYVEKGKGNYVVRATGFTSYQDRVVKIGKLLQFLQIVMSNPAMAQMAKLKDMAREIAKALDIEPDQFIKTVQEEQQEQAMMQQAPPQPPDVATQAKAEKDIAQAESTRVDTRLKVAKAQLELADREMMQAQQEQAMANAEIAPLASPVGGEQAVP